MQRRTTMRSRTARRLSAALLCVAQRSREKRGDIRRRAFRMTKRPNDVKRSPDRSRLRALRLKLGVTPASSPQTE